jgi:hypothetical protein
MKASSIKHGLIKEMFKSFVHEEAGELDWLRDPSQIRKDRLNILQRESRRHFRDKMRVYLKTKINEQERKSCKNILKCI